MVRIATRPSSLARIDTSAKPGHWTSGTLELVANNFDYRGWLATAPFPLDDVPYDLGAGRPIALAKGQKRLAELAWYVPAGIVSAKLNVELHATPAGRPVADSSFPLQLMPAHQYHLLVLAREPDRYRYVPQLTSVVPARDDLVDVTRSAHYRVSLPQVEQEVPLPSGSLLWTSIAYLWWDDFDASILSPEQALALLDWLHWGGHLIVSGPGSLDSLRGTFLEPYLPARNGGSRAVTSADLEPLNQVWSQGRPRFELSQPLTGVSLELGEGGVPLVVDHALQPLVAERLVGRGRIVVSALALNQRELIAWPGFDSFVNGCLLRREPRVFAVGIDGITRAVWYDRGASDPAAVDPLRNCRLRYFSRDTHIERGLQEPSAGGGGRLAAPDDEESWAESTMDVGPGVAGWNDSGAVAREARQVLRSAAGIDIPDRAFVARMLALYLVVLVPVNWGVFRLLGRPEWAWLAAPLAALGFAVLVTRMARLDVGFARAETELAIVELQPGYPRGHVTRYHSLYTSLTTGYRLEAADPQTLAQPFAAAPGDPLAPLVRSTVRLQSGRAMSLEGFQVASNSVGMLHSEQMLDLGGAIHLAPGGLEVRNETRLAIEGAAVAGPAGIAWIGRLEPNRSARLTFLPRATDGAAWVEERDRAPQTSRVAALGALSARRLVELAQDALADDQIRLVGWTEQPLEGLTIQPQAAQQRRLSVVVANLRYGRGAEPRPDINSPREPLLPPEEAAPAVPPSP